jgi:hypothetical protein
VRRSISYIDNCYIFSNYVVEDNWESTACAEQRSKANPGGTDEWYNLSNEITPEGAKLIDDRCKFIIPGDIIANAGHVMILLTIKESGTSINNDMTRIYVIHSAAGTAEAETGLKYQVLPNEQLGPVVKSPGTYRFIRLKAR